MSENKEYISQIQEKGSLHISEEVIMSIAAMAALEVEGVSGLGVGRGSDIAEMLGKKNPGKGIRITIDEANSITVDCSIVVKMGQSVIDVAKAVQEAVTSSVESVTGLKIIEVNVTVAGVALPKEQKK